jgi:hypothetical protein
MLNGRGHTTLFDFESWEPNNAHCLYVYSDKVG